MKLKSLNQLWRPRVPSSFQIVLQCTK